MSRHKLKRVEGHSNFYLNESSGVYYYKDESVGKFSTGKRTIREAKREAEIIKQTKLKNISMIGAKRDVLAIDNPPISEVYFEMLEQKRIEVSETTMGTWERSYHHGFGEFFTGKRGHVDDFTDQNLMKFKAWYLEEKPKRHAQKLVVHMFYFLRWLVKHKMLATLPDLDILKNLPELVEKNAKREPVGRNLTQVEDRDLMKAARKHSTTGFLMVTLGVRCGFRKESEALALEWNRVDLKEKWVKVWSFKNHGWRKMPITEEVVEAFQIHQAWVIETYGRWVKTVFPMHTLPNRPMSGQLFDKIWVEIKSAAKIKGRLRFHDLRHTFATRTAEYGIPPILACEALDMSLKIYQDTYCHPSEESVAEMMQKMAKKTSKKPTKTGETKE